MNPLRMLIAFSASVGVAYVLAVIFYTARILAGQASFGATYTTAQQVEAFLTNLVGLWLYGVMIAIALTVAFVIAWLARKILKPLAPIAYPVAGAAGILALLALVETQLGGGAGVIGGARTSLGVALQCLAGFSGGLVFSFLRPRAE